GCCSSREARGALPWPSSSISRSRYREGTCRHCRGYRRRMRVAVLLFGLLACGGGQKLNSKVAVRDAMTEATTDVDAMMRLMRGSVVSGGLWFDDAGCKQFSTGTVPDDKLREFATCLVGLKLQPR